MLFTVCGPQAGPQVETLIYCKQSKCPTFFKEPWVHSLIFWQVFVKGRRSFIESEPDEQLFWSRDFDGNKQLPDFQTFEAMVNNFLKVNFDVDLQSQNEDVFESLWDYNIRDMAKEGDGIGTVDQN